MKQKFPIVMLPTEKASRIIKDYNNKLILNSNNVQNLRDNYTFQHLYILSNDPIKEGDLVYNILSGLGKVTEIDKASDFLGVKYLSEQHEVEEDFDNVKKIISSTDKSLGLPLIPESYLPIYIKAYNEGKQIAEVELEINESTKYNLDELKEREYMGLKRIYNKPLLITNPDDSVIIHTKEDRMYSRDEMDDAFTNGFKRGNGYLIDILKKLTCPILKNG